MGDFRCKSRSVVNQWVVALKVVGELVLCFFLFEEKEKSHTLEKFF